MSRYSRADLSASELAACLDTVARIASPAGAGAAELAELAVAQARLERPHAALRSLVQAIDREPQRAASYALLAELLEAEGEAERAETWYHLACGLAPHDAGLRRRLAAYYVDHGLPYSAQRVLQPLPRDAAANAVLEELQALWGDRPVAVVVLTHNHAATIEAVLGAVFAQSYPVRQVYVLDNASVDDTLARLGSFPVSVRSTPDRVAPPAHRNQGVALAETELVALLEGDLVPEPHWLERLMVDFARRDLLVHQTTDAGAPIAAAMGTADDLHSVRVADAWRARHLPAYYVGRQSAQGVPWVFGGNAIYRRAAVVAAGGWDEQHDRAWDTLLSERWRAGGLRLTYSAEARCRRHRREDVPAVLAAAVGYQSAYAANHRFGVFLNGDLADLLAALPDLVQRWRFERLIDERLKLPELAYPTFLLLPWLVLSDLAVSARTAPPAARDAIEQTQAAVWLACFALVSECCAEVDLLAIMASDLGAVAPLTPGYRLLCDWRSVQALVGMSTGGNPLDRLLGRAPSAFTALLEALGGEWMQFDQSDWQHVVASARLAAAERGSLPATRLAVLRPGAKDEVGEADQRHYAALVDGLRARAGTWLLAIDPATTGVHVTEALLRVEGFAPQSVGVVVTPDTVDAAVDLALRLKERLPDETLVVASGPYRAEDGAALLQELPVFDGFAAGVLDWPS